jgi:RecA/RadA recombinase
MPPPSPAPARAELDQLLRDLGSEVRRGGDPREARADLATGIAALDALLGGGLARGRLSELHGPLSSGRTSVALALLARATEVGEVVAVIDTADAFHPESARSAGVQLERVLWARPTGVAEAVRASERLLQVRGFAAVLLDASVRAAEWEALSAAIWQRLTRAAAATGTALIVLSLRRVTGAHADLALQLQPMRAHFSGAPCLFEGLEIEAAIARQRRARSFRPAAVRLRAPD